MTDDGRQDGGNACVDADAQLIFALPAEATFNLNEVVL